MASKGGGKGRRKKRKPSRDPVDYDLMKALAKPQRVRALAILAERIPSPKQISDETGEALSSVSYHVTVLHKHGLIELVEKVPRRGAVEHFYRAVSPTLLPAGAWDNLPPALKKAASTCILREFFDDAWDAMEAGILDDPASELSWTPLVLDGLGFKEIGKLATGFLENVFEVQAKASERLAAKESGGKARRISATVFLASFLSSRSPKAGKKASATKRR